MYRLHKAQKAGGSTWSLILLKIGFNLKLPIMPDTISHHTLNARLSLVLFGQVKKSPNLLCSLDMTWFCSSSMSWTNIWNKAQQILNKLYSGLKFFSFKQIRVQVNSFRLLDREYKLDGRGPLDNRPTTN